MVKKAGRVGMARNHSDAQPDIWRAFGKQPNGRGSDRVAPALQAGRSTLPAE